MVLSGRGRRQKGKRGERKLATALREAFPSFAQDIRRGWQSRQGDDDPDVLGLPGFWLECKTGKMPNPRAALGQATLDAQGRAIPMAVIQDDRRPPFVALSLRDMVTVLQAAYGLIPPLSRDAARGVEVQVEQEESDGEG